MKDEEQILEDGKMSKPYWIKKRRNPQNGTYYYVAFGQLSARDAMKEESLSGDNIMLRYNSSESYRAACESFGVWRVRREFLRYFQRVG